jgi:eukaryotic-like serine/threonine-protein kinase
MDTKLPPEKREAPVESAPSTRYAPPSDKDLFPAWEKWLRAGWVALAACLLGAGVYFFVLPRLQKSPEEMIARRMAAPERLSPEKGFSIDPACSTDGSLVAYASDGGGGSLHIWVKPARGGPARQVSTGNDRQDREPDLSPDGRTLVYASLGALPGIYIAGLDASNARRLAESGSRPRFSPDGRHVAWYARYGWQPNGVQPASAIYVAPAGGGAPKRLAASFPHAQAPVWVDDAHLLFDGVGANGVPDWYVTPLDGGEPAPTGVTQVLRPAVRAWSVPDRWRKGKIYFAAARGEDLDLWEMRIGEDWKAIGPPERLTTGPERTGQIAFGSGSSVAFARAAAASDIYEASLDAETGKVTGVLKRLTDGTGSNRLPSVSPATGRMAYLSNRSGVTGIWVGGPGGGAGTRLTGYQAVSYRPVLSAEGTQLAYSTVEEGRCGVVVIDLKDQRRRFSAEGCMGIWDWAPDSRALLVYSSTESASGQVGVMEVPGNQRWPVLTHPKHRIYMPRFSGDGAWIAFTAGPAAGEALLYIAPYRGVAVSPDRWIAVSTGPASAPAWSPGGKLIYYRSEADGFDCVWAQPLSEGKHPEGEPFPVLHLHGNAPGMFRMGPFDFSMSVLKDRLVLGLAEHSGTIWIANLHE